MSQQQLIRKLYGISGIRLGIKFSICLTVVKVFGDFLYYINSDRMVTIPRNNQIEGVQHPLNPPVAIPYPY